MHCGLDRGWTHAFTIVVLARGLNFAAPVSVAFWDMISGSVAFRCDLDRP